MAVRIYSITKTLIVIILATAFMACSSSKITLLVGTYTDAGSEGIYAYRFDQNSGKFVIPESAKTADIIPAVGFTKIENPSFLTISNDNVVYAVTEKGDEAAALTSFRFNPQEFTFTKLASVPPVGLDPCYVSTNGKIVAVGNYSRGTMSIFPIDNNGAATAGRAVVEGHANGANKRQSTPHVHCAIFSPDGKYLFASDFSADRLIRYELSSGDIEYYAVDPESGPRHITFSPNGEHLYVIGELSGDVSVFDYDGSLSKKQVINADKVDAQGAADIHISPDERFLYTSLRLKNDGIAVFSIDSNGRLSEVGYTNTGKHPRNFTITPNGKFLLCACRDTNTIEVYSIDRNTGLLTQTTESINLSKPVCLIWHQN